MYNISTKGVPMQARANGGWLWFQRLIARWRSRMSAVERLVPKMAFGGLALLRLAPADLFVTVVSLGWGRGPATSGRPQARGGGGALGRRGKVGLS